MEKNKQLVMKVLKDMGYEPKLDSDQDIRLCMEMKEFYFFMPDEEEECYVNIVLPQFTGIKEGKEILALATCNIMTRDMKLLKVYVEKNHESVSASCDFIYTDEDSLKQNIVCSMEVMSIVKSLYRRKCAELEN